MTAPPPVAIPMADLRASLAETEPAWRANLGEMHDRGQYILGEQVARFEREFACAMLAPFSVGVGTGTSAIELCLREAGITSPRQQVIVPALTSPFTAQAVLAAGAVPRFADVEPQHLLLGAEETQQQQTPHAAALLAVHLYGQPCDLGSLSRLARGHGLPLLQDACQAHGALSDGLPFTSFSPHVAYSFYPTKNLGALGDGGAVATGSEAVDGRLRLLRDSGRRGGQVSVLPAINSRLDEMQACYLRAFLPRLADWNARRARLASLYDEALRGCPGVTPLRHRLGSVFHLYVVRAERRDALRQFLAERGVTTGVHYPVPLHLHPAFRSGMQPEGSLPVAERACREILSLPLYPHMPESSVLRVAEQVGGFYR